MTTADTASAREAALRACAVLDAIHAALLAGRLSDVGALGVDMAEALAGIGGLDDVDLAMTLRQKAVRNEACLYAAGRGLRAATRRVRDILAVAQGLQTYDGHGRRASLGPRSGILTRRV